MSRGRNRRKSDLSRFHSVVFRMRIRLGRTVMAAFMLAACSDATSPASELTAAQRRWEAWGPTTYDLTLRRGACECSSLAVRPIVVAVRDGVIQSKY